MSDLDNINSNFKSKIESVKSKEDLQILKTEFLGKVVKSQINLKT